MNNIAIVRADFYSNGDIIPLSITYIDGHCDYIGQIIKIKKAITVKGKKEYKFICFVNNKEVILQYCDYAWKGTSF